MRIFSIRKNPLSRCIAIAIVVVFFASSAALHAQETNKQKKNKDSATARPAPAPAPKARPSENHSNAGGSGKSGGGGSSAGGSGSGSSTPGRSGGSGAAGRSGGTPPAGASGGSAGTGSTGASGDNQRRKNRSEGAGSGSGGTTSTGPTGTAGGSAGTTSTGSPEDRQRRKNRPEGAGSGSGGTTSTGTAGGSSGTTSTGSPDDRQRRKNRAAGGTDGGATTSAGSTGVTTSTGDNTRKKERAAGGNTGPAGTGTTSTGKHGTTTGAANTTTSVRPGITKFPNGKPEKFRSRDGAAEARFGRDGKVREIRTHEMSIIHGPGRSRTIVVERADHSRIVAYHGGYGYVQRPFAYRGREFASRTYFYNGRPYARYYQRYPYRGLYLEGYRPYRYYRPAFYGWAYRPWRSPVRYSWGFSGRPWYGYYGYYFTPYSSYPSASFWLTDYLISSSLQAAYQQRLDSQSYTSSNFNGQVGLTPEVKRAIADEVEAQLAVENSESQTVTGGGDVDVNSSGLPRILAETSPSHPHVFVVASTLNVTDGEGQDCTLTEGDVLRLSTPPANDSTSADLQVFASKNQDCPKGSRVVVGLVDLQEMQNHMRASIDQGLQEMQAHPGGLPAPPSAASQTVEASFSSIAPPADPNVSSELQQQAQAADRAEQGVLDQVRQEAGSTDDGNSKPPIEISIGQTVAEVVAALGNPTRIANLGTKKIYVYPDMKITFVNGKVSDVE